MDVPENLMVIDTLMVLDGPVDWDRVVALARRGMVDPHPPFRQTVIPPRFRIGPPRWTDDPAFTMERQLVRVTLPDGSDETLQGYIDSCLPTPLPADRPMWQMHLIDGYRHGAVLYTRIHHCIADGIALTQVTMSLTSSTPDGDLDPVPATAESPRRPRPRRSPRERVAQARAMPARFAQRVPEVFSARTARAGWGQLTRGLRQVERLTRVADKMILADRPTSPLTGAPGIEKRAVWAEPFPLADVKRLGRTTGATVNDVLMAVMAGALGDYVAEHGGQRQDLPTMVPVNVRNLAKPLPADLGNEFALVMVHYPAQTPALLERIAETHRRMDAIKNSMEAPVVFGSIWMIGHTTKDAERGLVDFFSNKAIGVTSNVPGPRETRYLAGARARGMLAWVPTTGEQTLGMSIFSYDGSVWVGFKADAATIPDPENLVRAFNAQVQEMLRLADAI